jgi:hypothetical protein
MLILGWCADKLARRPDIASMVGLALLAATVIAFLAIMFL